jgi:putative ABC transport system substrate-binding protein
MIFRLAATLLLCVTLVPASAQQMHTIGVLAVGSPDSTRDALWTLFKTRLREFGHAENRDVRFEFYWSEGKPDALPRFARQLVERRVSVIVTVGTPAAFAASEATSSIPIVLVTGTSVGTGLADGAARKKNVTGMSDMPAGLSAKRLEILNEGFPRASTFGLLSDESNPASPIALRETEEAAARLGVATRVFGVRGPDDFPGALASMKKDGVAGFLVLPGAMFFTHRKRLAELAIEHRLPALFVRREYAEAGGLISYGASIQDNYRRAAAYVDRILRGARPGELAVDEVSEFELVVNARTARAIGAAIAPSLLERATSIDR